MQATPGQMLGLPMCAPSVSYLRSDSEPSPGIHFFTTPYQTDLGESQKLQLNHKKDAAKAKAELKELQEDLVCTCLHI